RTLASTRPVGYRPLVDLEVDNLDHAFATERYKGDGVSIVDANNDGVPDKPAAALLRARATASFDEQGRVYRTNVFDVNPTTGAISTGSLQTDLWFDHRGETIKASYPGEPPASAGEPPASAAG